MEPTRRQLPKEAKAVIPPKANTLEGHLFASAAVKASRKFLQGNPEGKKSYPRREIMPAVDHLYNYPGDMKLFEGAPAPRGKHAKLEFKRAEPQLDRPTGPKSRGPVSGSKKSGGIEPPKRKPRGTN